MTKCRSSSWSTWRAARFARGSPPIGKTPEDVVRWLSQVAQALDYIHSRGVVHRDVKPANILYDEHGHVVLSDFGISRAMPSHVGGTSITEMGLGLGTPEYMAPEQRESSDLSGGADQFALGATVFRRTGRAGRPSVSETKSRSCCANPKARRRIFRPWWPGLASRTAAVVSQAMSKYPVHRFPTCGAFAAAFKASLGPRVIRQPAPAPRQIRPAAPRVPRATPRSAPAKARRERLPGAWLALLAVVGAVAVLLLRDRAPAGTAPLIGTALQWIGPAPGTCVSTQNIRAVVRVAGAGARTQVRVNGILASRDGELFSATVATAGDGTVRLQVHVDDAEAGTTHVVVDTTPPTIEVASPMSLVTETDGALVTVRGRVIDDNAMTLFVNDRPIRTSPQGSFHHHVVLSAGQERVLVIRAIDAAGNESPPVRRTIRRGNPTPTPAPSR